ncbi:MAG: hypothetical protein SPK06_03875 [Kiritimatiellia bacterium]|nr:hypothetical protein [Kiritimatiellia bacterium]
MDAYAASKLAGFAGDFGTVDTTTLSANNILATWDSYLAYMINNRIPVDRIRCKMTPPPSASSPSRKSPQPLQRPPPNRYSRNTPKPPMSPTFPLSPSEKPSRDSPRPWMLRTQSPRSITS